MSGTRDRSPAGATESFSIVTVSGSGVAAPGTSTLDSREDLLAVEEPLEIRLVLANAERASHRISITMRSPGHDAELACGFLLAEGILSGAADIWRVSRCEDADAENADNVIEVHLAPEVRFDADRFRRNVYTNSGCGVCGKESIEQLKALGGRSPEGAFRLDPEVVLAMPAALLISQNAFSSTGGLHACGLFSVQGDLELVREDVGRHNAVDKVVGRLLLDGRLPASSNVMLVSGRASFELVHKAMAAGVSTLLAVGAPSSLAVETARAFGMTLVGFLRGESFNVYSGRERIAPDQAAHQ